MLKLSTVRIKNKPQDKKRKNEEVIQAKQDIYRALVNFC